MTHQAKLDAATLRQVEAAEPTASTWLSANAGSGKTRVLTERVARLLLAGASPQAIVCLTYTKAAASEMQNRLFQRLGDWAMADEDALGETLARLGVADAADPETRAEARRLFARAIETPGGLKIQTIHAFCAAILRRFPLEAGVAPGFREMDDAAAEALRTEVLGRFAETRPEALAALAAEVPDEDFGPVCGAILGARAALAPPLDAAGARAAFGLAPDETRETIRARALAGMRAEDLEEIAAVFAASTASMQKLAPGFAAAARAGLPPESFEALCQLCLVADRSRPNAKVPTKAARAALGALADRYDAFAEALAAACTAERALAAAEKTAALHRFAGAFLPAYEAAKAERGLLDFDDLIARTERLLSTPGVAEWVLYKLDGGIEHLLVDEAQDTSPAQWRVIELLTQEFTSGAVAPGARTLFVVGDLKQSIYSFQGAAPESFAAMRDAFGARLAGVGTRLLDLELEHSFRSAPEILRVVDETFPRDNRAGLGPHVSHIAFHADRPGRVELWPRIPPAGKAEDAAEWWNPVDQIGEEHHHARLAQQVADAAARMVAEARITGEAGPRPVHAGDILILVQSRGTLFHEIIRACKAAGLDVAGADLLKLGEELAVRDLTALLAFLDTPEDDLSLAAALRSPLFGWSEGDLYDLAAGRGGAYLWQALRARAGDWPETHAALSDLLGRADFLRPYELLSRILTRHDGRRRLVARLGPEAADGIDALLARALAHERDAVPSLTGFLAAQESAGAEVKRQAEGKGAKLRVMTVHGAKGLESPIVILPDTAHQKRLREVSARVLVDEDGRALWSVPKGEAPPTLLALRERAEEKRLEESRRLLYVAMTRAEQWLVVAAAGDLGSHGDTWYEQVAAGLERAGAVADETHGPGGLVLQSPGWPAPAPHAPDRPDAAPVPPSWALAAPPAPARAPRPLAPSDLGGAKALPGEGLPEAEALARGTRLHLLLEHLPGQPEARWPAIAAALCAPGPCPEDELAEAAAMLRDPALAPLFGADALAEVPFSAALPALGGARVAGTIDRLVVAPGRVLAVDFKTNATLPERPEDTPEGLLRQMGAYAAALSQIYPDCAVETAILWTRAGRLMPLPADLAAAALARAAGAGAGAGAGAEAGSGAHETVYG